MKVVHRALILFLTVVFPAVVFAGGFGLDSSTADIGTLLPLWTTLPFTGILLSIALIPLLLPRFWHRHFPKVSAFWAIVFAVPFIFFFREKALHEIAHIILIDYVPFILLLWALFTVSGGIYVRGT